MKSFILSLAAIAILTSAHLRSEACTRVVYNGAPGITMVGRSLDWKTPIPTNLYVYPRGISKQGADSSNPVRWTSRYGAVYAVGYDGGVTEGMNERGLVVNGLFCKGTIYENDSTLALGRPQMSLAMFVAWMLDLNDNVPELTARLRRRDFTIAGATFDGGTVSTLHFGITDRLGNTAVVEFVNGELDIYEGSTPTMPVLTNDPIWPQMNAIEQYWSKVPGSDFLPGSVKSPDRFVRATFFDRNVVATADADTAVTICRSIVMNASVPFLYTFEGEPNVSSTQWRSISDISRLRYYFDIVTRMGMIYVDLSNVSLTPGSPILKFDTSDAPCNLAGEINRVMLRSEGFNPMY